MVDFYSPLMVWIIYYFIYLYLCICIKGNEAYPRTFETDAKFSLFTLHSLDPSHGGQKSKYLYTWDLVTIIERECYMSHGGGGEGDVSLLHRGHGASEGVLINLSRTGKGLEASVALTSLTRHPASKICFHWPRSVTSLPCLPCPGTVRLQLFWVGMCGSHLTVCCGAAPLLLFPGRKVSV